MAVTQYIGARYVPKFNAQMEWNSTNTYEPLTVVLHEGNSYTSKQSVPVGIDIANTDYWAETGNYNAQVEAYRQEVLNLQQNVSANTTSNTNQDKQLAGTADSGLKQLISANTTSNTNQDKQLAGTADSGLKQLISANSDLINKIYPLDKTPTENSIKGISSGGVFDSIIYKQATPTMIAYSAPGNSSWAPVHLYASYDNYRFGDCGLIHDTSGNTIYADSSSLFIDNDNLYIIENTRMYRAIDLLTFELIQDTKSIFQTGVPSSLINVWGTFVFFDTISNQYYIYAALGSKDGGYDGDFQIYCAVAKSISDFTPSLVKTKINLEGFDNVIDPNITYYNGTYYIAFKDETTAEIHVATSTTPTSFTVNDTLFTHKGRGFESPQIIKLANKLTLWADGFYISGKDSAHPNPYSPIIFGGFDCNGWFPLETNALFNMIIPAAKSTTNHSASPKLRHPAFSAINTVIYKLLNSTILTFTSVDLNTQNCGIIANSLNTVVDGDSYTITNAPVLNDVGLGSHKLILNYEQVFNFAKMFYIKNGTSNSNASITLNNNFNGGSSTGPYLPNGNGETTAFYGADLAYQFKVRWS
jgi:hypothetical protein